MVSKIIERKNSISDFIFSQEAENKFYESVQFWYFSKQFSIISIVFNFHQCLCM